MNNFKDYGFEADFEGEILKEVKYCRNQKYYIGYSIDIREGLGYPYPKAWLSSGACIDDDNNIVEDFSLKPIKKEWYENADNFPCIVYHIYNNSFHIATDTTIDENSRLIRICDKYRPYDVFRPATKEEVLTLLVKE